MVCKLARPEGFEPPTYGLEVRCSIQLSYRRAKYPAVQAVPGNGMDCC
jgi:hypothetical protein